MSRRQRMPRRTSQRNPRGFQAQDPTEQPYYDGRDGEDHHADGHAADDQDGDDLDQIAEY
jgi:hypothetical protein